MICWADSSLSENNGILGREHRDCQKTLQADWTKVVNLDAESVQTHDLDGKSLEITLTTWPATAMGTA